MHTFLTGDVQVGKTTIIKTLLARTQLSADGFLTYWDTTDGGERALFLSPYTTEVNNADSFIIARAGKKGLIKDANIAYVFDVHGAGILSGSGRRDVVIMDELGFLESGAMAFQKAVLRHIDGIVPILGVIKPARTEFLDAVRNHPRVNIYEVTTDNREAILSSLLEKL